MHAIRIYHAFRLSCANIPLPKSPHLEHPAPSHAKIKTGRIAYIGVVPSPTLSQMRQFNLHPIPAPKLCLKFDKAFCRNLLSLLPSVCYNIPALFSISVVDIFMPIRNRAPRIQQGNSMRTRPWTMLLMMLARWVNRMKGFK